MKPRIELTDISIKDSFLTQKDTFWTSCVSGYPYKLQAFSNLIKGDFSDVEIHPRDTLSNGKMKQKSTNDSNSSNNIQATDDIVVDLSTQKLSYYTLDGDEITGNIIGNKEILVNLGENSIYDCSAILNFTGTILLCKKIYQQKDASIMIQFGTIQFVKFSKNAVIIFHTFDASSYLVMVDILNKTSPFQIGGASIQYTGYSTETFAVSASDIGVVVFYT